MKDPNFFIIGAPKSGTTSLAHYLAQHRQVFVSSPKELFYWSCDHPVARTRHNVFQLEDYLAYFENADDDQHIAVGEGSTNYLQSRTAVNNILEFCPESRFIVLLRDPVEAAYGMHGELLRHYFEDEEEFTEAWALQGTRAKGNRIPPKCVMVHQLQYADVVNYLDQLQRLFAAVPEQNRRVFMFERFKDDTRSVYQETLEFLGVPDDDRVDFPRMNPARQYRSGFVGRLYQTPPNWLEPFMKWFRVWYSSQPESRRGWIGNALSKNQPRKALPPEFEQELRELMLPQVEGLEELLQMDLSSWKTSG